MKNKTIDIAIIALLFVNTALPQYQITNSVISSGGNVISNSNNNIVSTLGEPFIGKSVSAANQHQIGFWYVYQQQTITAVEDELTTIPTVFKLEQNYPNPFNPSTIIKFAVPEKSNVVIKIYDILGSEIVTLVNEEMDAGWYQRSFNANGMSTGVYLFRMEAGNYVNTKKMILIK